MILSFLYKLSSKKEGKARATDSYAFYEQMKSKTKE